MKTNLILIVLLHEQVHVFLVLIRQGSRKGYGYDRDILKTELLETLEKKIEKLKLLFVDTFCRIYISCKDYIWNRELN